MCLVMVVLIEAVEVVHAVILMTELEIETMALALIYVHSYNQEVYICVVVAEAWIIILMTGLELMASKIPYQGIDWVEDDSTPKNSILKPVLSRRRKFIN